jgi:hypothetical protein
MPPVPPRRKTPPLLAPRDVTETARQGQGIGDIEAMRQMATTAIPEVLRNAPVTSTPMSVFDMARAVADRDLAGAGMAGLGMIPFAGSIKAIGNALPARKALSSIIADWKWRPTAQVREELGITELPEHIKQFGQFMEGQAQKAAQKGLSVRDVAKANAITQASIQRSALDAQKLRDIGFPLPEDVQGKIRPEGAMAELLMSPVGKAYLDQVESGAIDPATVETMVQLMKPFGKDNDLRQKLIRNIETANLNEELTGIVGEAYGGSQAAARQQMQDLTERMHGIGPSKRGFIGSLLGYGADPTLDARQIILNTGRPTAEAQPFLRRAGGKGAIAGVGRLSRRQEALGVEVPQRLQPFKQHLIHHSVWDKAANEVTTHGDLIRAMLTAGMVGGVGLGAYGASKRQPDGL